MPQFFRSGGLFVALPVLVWVLGAQPTAWAKYDDTLFLKNGDRLMGDIKELSRDMLRYKTDALGTVYVRWTEVRSLETAKSLRIELKNGNRLVGSLSRSETPEQLTITTRRADFDYRFEDVVVLVPLKLQRGWLERLEGAARFGLNGQKGAQTLQWNVGANALFRGERYDVSARFDSIVTNKSNDSDSERVNFSTTYRRFRAHRWFWSGLAGYEKNDELGIDNRFSAGGGLGRFLVRSNYVELVLAGGMLANREFRADGATNQLESYLGSQLALFQHAFPKTDISASAIVYPSLTDSGRVRSNIDLSVKREFIEDLLLNLSVYYSTDNKAPNESSRQDYGVVTSLEYTF